MLKMSPRFRRDLSAAATEQDGAPCVLVTDATTGTSFTFYEFEYDLAHQLNGQPLDDIIVWAGVDYQTTLTAEAIDEFATKLRELGFLEPDGAGPRAESGGSDSAEVEWKASEGGPTAQNVPDASVLAGLAGGKPPPRPDAAAKIPPRVREPLPPELANIDELPLDALNEIVDSGPVSSSGVPKAVPTTPSGATNPFLSSGGVSRGFFERRQPPNPDAVVATPFEDVSMRFRAPPPERQRSSTGIVVTFIVMILAGGGGGYYYWMRQHPTLPEAQRLRVVAPKPTAVYRWFASAGTVVDLESRSMAFDSGGKVVEIMPVGTKFAAGDTLGKLQGAAALEGELAKHRSKMAFFEQLRDSMKASGKKGNLRDVEEKITARKKMLADVETSLAKLELRATESGAIVETPVKVDTVVAAKAPALKWRGRNLHGDFTMDQEDFAKAAKLEFCRVEVSGFASPAAAPGAPSTTAAPAATPPASGSTSPDASAGEGATELRYVDCTLPPPAPPPVNGVPQLLRKFIVTLPTEAGLVTGQQLRLARKRFDGVFELALTAVAPTTETEGTVWVAAPNGTAEQRHVTIAESRDEVLVSDGVNVGDEIIVDPPRDLTPGALVDPIR
jgi:multidrug efflux pump subunit AcrA (membrane-fusion protein)